MPNFCDSCKSCLMHVSRELTIALEMHCSHVIF